MESGAVAIGLEHLYVWEQNHTHADETRVVGYATGRDGDVLTRHDKGGQAVLQSRSRPQARSGSAWRPLVLPRYRIQGARRVKLSVGKRGNDVA